MLYWQYVFYQVQYSGLQGLCQFLRQALLGFYEEGEKG
jgi:hypothetical protein